MGAEDELGDALGLGHGGAGDGGGRGNQLWLNRELSSEELAVGREPRLGANGFSLGRPDRGP